MAESGLIAVRPVYSCIYFLICQKNKFLWEWFIQEIKQGYLAQRHAQVAAKNLKLLMTGGEECEMGIYKPAWPLAIVSLGRNEAVMQIFFLTIIGCIPGMIKSRDLFVGKTRKQLGLKPDLP